MAIQSLLYKRKYPINEFIQIEIPTVGEILEQEDAYYSMVSLITATPYDMMVQLDDMKIDFAEINDYELFVLMFQALKTRDTSLIFGTLDLNKFSVMVNPQNNTVVLRDPESGAMIDRNIHSLVCQAIRKIHHLKRNNRKPANDAAKKYMIQRARTKMRRRKNRIEDSQLEELIVALVNTEQFHYDFDSVKSLTIYQFNESVQQVIKKIDFDNKMHGIYAGTISAKDMGQDELNWLTHK
ncbi:hypothetical protein [Flavonifractor plautii]|uniref:hypothetical protein n=1 Tax=Flavonifractor plautii TaxID=292800 RepID=UPI0018AAD8A4|nr:hypothetical protein [Flavonifractor plautii]